ncbi:hypothetical protein RvY_10543 [Ramazzottius varieornatus]|uniref:Uncharacterized protein n=1 Tax=Ramazzottius varieornatus TaxID=947166 RepID=A0A1D1VIG6_RAMVA|nr:hypothetical protein RvY_10543 [Ramazzottius varieornatus]
MPKFSAYVPLPRAEEWVTWAVQGPRFTTAHGAFTFDESAICVSFQSLEFRMSARIFSLYSFSPTDPDPTSAALLMRWTTLASVDVVVVVRNKDPPESEAVRSSC